MKLLKLTLATAAVALSAATASATMTFTQFLSGADYGRDLGDQIALLAAHSSNANATNTTTGRTYSDSFSSIKNSGGVLLEDFLAANPSYYIASAFVKFGFSDTGTGDSDAFGTDSSTDYREYVLAAALGKALSLDGADRDSDGAVEVDGFHATDPLAGFDYRKGDIDSSDFGGLEDGDAEFSVTANTGDVWLKTAKISVTLARDTTPVSVPDTGATLSLLGLGLLGLVAVRRRR